VGTGEEGKEQSGLGGYKIVAEASALHRPPQKRCVAGEVTVQVTAAASGSDEGRTAKRVVQMAAKPATNAIASG